MKYQAYPEYKDSGVEWVDSIPNHWGKVNIRWQAQLYAGGTPSKNVEDYWEEGTVPWINSGAVNQIIVTEPSMYITEQAYKNSSAKWIPKNALVMALAGQGKTKGMVAKLAIDTTCNQSMAAIVPNKISNSKYLFWWLTFNYQNIRNMAGGDLRDGLNLELLGNIGCPIPTDEEKDCIANFLDHETAKIDTLIEKQQQLIKLLKEKRQAVISHAVTKGLNPNVLMRDSGVEWLGEVPEHWEITKAKFVSNIFVPQRNKPELNDDSGVAWATMEDMKNTYIETTKHFVDSASLKTAGSKVLKAGAVIASCVGSFDVASINKIDVIINQQLQAFIPYSIKAEYLRELIGISKSYFELIGTAATLVYVNQQGFENLPVLLPTISEQEKICSHIETECCKFDRLIFLSEETIGLLQERRTALISAAVTGKIDVRNWQAPETLQSNIQTH